MGSGNTQPDWRFMFKRILGQVRKAVQDFGMISEGDRIAVGVSGGKDSITLMLALNKLKEFYPANFELEAVTIDPGLEGMDFSSLAKLCREHGINYTIEKTCIGKIIFDARQEENPCSLCANLRRGALSNAALRLNCNKVALAHHRDDVIETLLMSTFYEGRIHTFSPVTCLDRKGLFVIRPLIYVEEKQIRAFIRDEGIEIVKNPCPANGYTKRQEIKALIHNMSKETKDIKSNIFGAIKRSGLDGWRI
jgi:tRNA 2-thiocytidine biosynthesis protein TtcA